MESAAHHIVETLTRAGSAAYYAGGCVRDRLLGVKSKDIDIATSATPDQVQSLFPRTTDLEGKSFGVIRVLHGDHVFEIATFRIDKDYQDGRHPTSVQFATAEEDAQRRDFTINGIFYDPLKDKFIDYVGGQADLAQKIVRAIGNPLDRFREDKLRLLRAIRFAAALDFAIEPKTWEAVQTMAPEVKAVSAERIRDELDKIWTGPRPALGLDLLDASGLLKVVLPEVAALHGVEQPPQFHPEGDVFKHTRLMLSHLQNAPLELALSVLFHDVGKKPTQTVDETGRIRFNGHETVGAAMARKIMTRLRYSNEMIEKVDVCVRNHMTFKDVPNMRLSTLKRLLGRDTFPVELELHRIDCSSSHGDLSIYEALKQRQSEFKPEEIKPPRLITGNDLIELGLSPGKEIGRILAAVEEAQLEGKLASREQALEMARSLVRNN